MRMLKKVIIFLLVLVALVIALRILNWFGATTAIEGIRRFNSLEEAHHQLRLRTLYLPSYFPDYLEWPPFEILGQTTPYKLVLLHIRNQESKEVVLAIRQVESAEVKPPATRLEPFHAGREEAVQLHEHTALLEEGRCADNAPCTRISWSEQSHHLNVILKDGREEILRIASSMEVER